MRQKGFAHLFVIIAIFIIGLGGVGYSIYKKTTERNQSQQVSETIPTEENQTPALSPTSDQKPTPLSKPKITSTNTPVPTTQSYNGVCDVITLAGSNPNEVVLTYSLTSSGGRYMKEARWDLNNDGQWDHDFSSSNAQVTTNLTSGNSKTVRLQLKLSDNTFTNACIKNISAPSGTWITIWGYVFSDNNCSGFMDSSESGIVDVPVRITKISDYSTYGTTNTDGGGKFSYNSLLNELIEMTVTMTSPSGYKSHPTHIIGSSLMGYGKNTNVQMNIPQVPYASVGQCSF